MKGELVTWQQLQADYPAATPETVRNLIEASRPFYETAASHTPLGVDDFARIATAVYPFFSVEAGLRR